jgi:hypothetical protein
MYTQELTRFGALIFSSGLMVMLAVVQVAGDCLKRLPSNGAAAAAAMAAAASGSRPWMAAAVALGEQQLLQQLKKEGLMLMLQAQQVSGRVCNLHLHHLLPCASLFDESENSLHVGPVTIVHDKCHARLLLVVQHSSDECSWTI